LSLCTARKPGWSPAANWWKTCSGVPLATDDTVMAAMESASVPEVTDAYKVAPSAESASPPIPYPESIVATCFPARLVTVISLLAATNR